MKRKKTGERGKRKFKKKDGKKSTNEPGRVRQRRQQHALLGVERDDLVRVVGRQLVVPLGEERGDLRLGGVGAGLHGRLLWVRGEPSFFVSFFLLLFLST